MPSITLPAPGSSSLSATSFMISVLDKGAAVYSASLDVAHERELWPHISRCAHGLAGDDSGRSIRVEDAAGRIVVSIGVLAAKITALALNN